MPLPKEISVDFYGDGTSSVISDVPKILGTARYNLSPQWKPIETAPAMKPLLVRAPEWKHADVCMMHEEDGWWYSPVDGSDVFPQPTEWMDIPK